MKEWNVALDFNCLCIFWTLTEETEGWVDAEIALALAKQREPGSQSCANKILIYMRNFKSLLLR